MYNRLYRFIERTIKIIMKRPMIFGANQIDQSKPAIFVANHLGAFGPVALTVFLPFKSIPWVTHEVTDKKLCPKYIKDDFVEPQIGLRPPLSRLVSVVIGRLCVSMMEHVEAIPVYKKSRKLIITMERTVKKLEDGERVLIFPEIPDTTDRNTFLDFNTGFVNIARKLYEKRGLIVNFYPVCVNKETNTIIIGKGVAFCPDRPFRLEKDRIVKLLRDTILRMYRDAEEPVEWKEGILPTA